MDDLRSADGDQAGSDLLEGGVLSRAERRDQQTQRILDAAKTCFQRSGFQGASMQSICAEAGMSPGALYRYFPSKESIIEAITQADRLEDARIFDAMFDNPSVIDGVVEAVMAHIRHSHENGMTALFAEIRAESMRNDAIRNTCQECMMSVHGRIGAYVAAAMERGEIEPVADLEHTLAMFMAIGEGLALNDFIANGMPTDVIERMARAVITALLRPTGANPAIDQR